MSPPLPPREPIDSPVFQRARQFGPQTTQPANYGGLALGVGGACILGVIVFASLSSGRTARAPAPIPQPAVIATAPQPVPMMAPPSEPLPPPPPAPPALVYAPQPPPPPAAVVDLITPRWRAPAVVVDLSQGAAAALAPTLAERPAGPPGALGEDSRFTAEERFAQRVSADGVETTQATRLRDLSHTAAQGTVIPAVLETAVNSDLPGSVRAVVSRDVRGFDGTTVLIPRGSKLIGQYRSAVAAGQTRAFVIWSRLLTPHGVSIDIGSPATDRLGRGGLDGDTDTHFLRRFGAAILLSVMSAGLELASRSESGNTTALIIGSPQQATRVAEIALQKQIDIPPTIRVDQGTPLQVFVARDLEFSGVMTSATP